MSSVNDFKTLNATCRKYFDIFKAQEKFSDPDRAESNKERFGFYFFILDNLASVDDVNRLKECLIDTDFNKVLSGNCDDDHGVDAVVIDDESKSIMLFNFKFRESFKETSTQSENDIFISTKAINAILNQDASGLSGKVKTAIQSAIDKMDSDDVWALKLYMVSNESNPAEVDKNSVQQLIKHYEMEIVTICLPDIKNMMYRRPEPINAELILDKDAIMSFTEDSISSSKSYIARINAADLIRITCTSAELRAKYNIENYSELSSQKLDYGTLFDNVRGYVLRSKYNSSISDTLKNEPSKFFLYNNGITIVTKGMNVEGVNAGIKVRVSIRDFQVLNGGQTLRTIHDFNMKDESNILDCISKAQVLVRVFNSSNEETIAKIAEYTNSQNSISNLDLKSLSPIQIQIEKYLSSHDIVYARKSGDTGIDPDRKYKYKISMSLFGQILWSSQGQPDKASTRKQDIWGEEYSNIFNVEGVFDIEDSAVLIALYYEIKSLYADFSRQSEVKTMEQKYFYIIYMCKFFSGGNISDYISLLEEAIEQYDANLSAARKLIQVKFKESLNEFALGKGFSVKPVIKEVKR